MTLTKWETQASCLPFVDEEHPGIPLHYGCDLGGVDLTIHSSSGFRGIPTRNAQSPVIVLGPRDVKGVALCLVYHLPPTKAAGRTRCVIFQSPA